jgi:hypothetical protein
MLCWLRREVRARTEAAVYYLRGLAGPLLMSAPGASLKIMSAVFDGVVLLVGCVYCSQDLLLASRASLQTPGMCAALPLTGMAYGTVCWTWQPIAAAHWVTSKCTLFWRENVQVGASSVGMLCRANLGCMRVF